MSLPLLLGALLAPAIAAPIPVELPPGESIEDWEPALELARQVIPDLIFGPALGPGSSVRIVGGTAAWQLDIRTDHGHATPVDLPIPTSPASRIELLLVAVDLLGDSPPPAATADASPQSSDWTTGFLRLALGVSLRPGNHHGLSLVGVPVDLSWRSIGVAPILSVALPYTLTDGLTVASGTVGAWFGWVGGDELRLRAGTEIGMRLRTFEVQDIPTQHDWTTEAGASLAAAWPVGEHLWLEPGLRFTGDLPPITVDWRGEMHDLPAWQLQAVLGLQPRRRPVDEPTR